MKKVFSVFLAALMLAFCMAPAFAADGSHTVNFTGPSAYVDDDAYIFVKCKDGAVADFELMTADNYDKENGYVYYNPETERQGDPETEPGGLYYKYNEILFDEDKAKFDDKRYKPVEYASTETIADGEQVAFFVYTNEKYDNSSVVVLAGGEILPPRATGEYVITVTDDVTIAVREFDEAGREVLLRNHYTVALTSGDGYSVKTLKNENNKYVYYGDNFRFRVKVAKGYSNNDMKVKVVKTGNDLSEFLGEDADFITTLMDKTPALNCITIDEDGCYVYEAKNITADCKVMVSGVREEKESGIIALLKRILRLILHAFGVDTNSIPFLAELVNEITVDYDASSLGGYGINCVASASSKPNVDAGSFQVLSGEGVTFTLSTKNDPTKLNIDFSVIRNTVDENGNTVPGSTENQAINWIAHVNRYSAEIEWTASVFVSTITGPTSVNITVR